jgi:hypothetical protein
MPWIPLLLGDDIIAAECNDQSLGDLTIAGNPETTDRVDFNPSDFLQYDNVNYDVYQKEMHNRIVTVAIEKDFGPSDVVIRETLKNHIFDTWAIFWKEFGGFPFQSYTVVFGNNLPYDADTTGSGERGEGFETSSESLTNYPAYSHGIYHAWNCNAFRQDEGGSWFQEGVTTYYGFRQSRNTSYIEGLEYAYNQYIQAYDAGKDVALDSIRGEEGNPDFLQYWKGALVAYLFDQELSKYNHHLGEVARIIYQRYGVDSQGAITNDQFLSVFNEVSGADFTGFFDKYIYGIEPLPLNGSSFEWVCHE